MIIRRSDRFYRDYRKLPKQIQKQSNKKLIFLLSNIDHPSLRVKRVKKYRGVFELSITRQYRCLFRIKNNIYHLDRVGKHDDLLK